MLILIPSLAQVGVRAQNNQPKGVLRGTIYNTEYNRPFMNVHVYVEGAGGTSRSDITERDGNYYFELSPGRYNLTVIYKDTVLESVAGIMVDGNGTSVHDIYKSYRMKEDVRLEGYVEREGQDPNDIYRIKLNSTKESYWNETVTDQRGHYALNVPEGEYNISVFKGNELLYTGTGVYASAKGHTWHNVTLEQDEIEEITLGSVINFVFENGYFILILIGVVFALIFLFGLLSSRLKKLAEVKRKHIAPDLFQILSFTVKAVYGIISFYIILNISGFIGGFSENALFSYLLSWLNAIMIIFVLVLIGRLALFLIKNFVEKIRERKVGEGLPTTVLLLNIVLKYSVIGILGFLIIVTLLSAFGMYDLIYTSMIGFFSRNLGYLTLIIFLVILGYFASKLIKTFISDIEKRSTKYSPHMIRTASKMVSFSIYFVFGLIIIFSLLSMANMQEIGSTILVILSTMLGLVVAMAATGSIGNILSGLVLQSMKPYDKGDRVKVGIGIIGDVEDLSLLFTLVRTLNNEIVSIPNNLILENEITNYSRSGVVAIDINTSIGYEIPASMVTKLLRMGAKATNGILADPKPYAIATEFKDYAVEYKLRAFTDMPKTIPLTRSRLMNNIQRVFYETGVEILSPWQFVKRTDKPPDIEEVKERFLKYNLMEEKIKEEGALEEGSIGAAMDMFEQVERGSKSD